MTKSTNPLLTTIHFCMPYNALIHRFVSFLSRKHTDHRYFIDFRSINNHRHNRRSLSTVFTKLQTYRLSSTYACWSIKENVSGRYSVIPFFDLSVQHNDYATVFRDKTSLITEPVALSLYEITGSSCNCTV